MTFDLPKIKVRGALFFKEPCITTAYIQYIIYYTIGVSQYVRKLLAWQVCTSSISILNKPNNKVIFSSSLAKSFKSVLIWQCCWFRGRTTKESIILSCLTQIGMIQQSNNSVVKLKAKKTGKKEKKFGPNKF